MKVVRYFAVGGISALVDIGLFAVFIQGFGFAWFYVALITFMIATLVNYELSIRHVFESEVRYGKQQERALVFIVSGAGLIVNQLVLWMLIEVWLWPAVLAKLGATTAVFSWNYLSRHHFIFKPRP